MNRYLVKTLGCKANLYDSQLIEAELQKRGWLPLQNSEEADQLVCVVNSCTVTDEADRQSRKTASKLSRDYPKARVVVTGCAAEVDPERIANSVGIHYVIGNRDKPQLVDLILKKFELPLQYEAKSGGEVLGQVETYSELLSRHPMDREWIEPAQAFQTPAVGFGDASGMTRAFLKIQEGCNAFCTYCIIPYGRGPSRSLRPRELIAQVKELTARGIRELVITGTNIGDYGTDWSESVELPFLLKTIFSETTIERVRVSSLDPVEISPELLELMRTEPRFCPHFHVSLQSASDRVLKLMKRKYGSAEVIRCLETIAKLSAPAGGAFVGMDVITGFPGETEKEFEETLNRLEQLPWHRLHVFPYSERAGTPATRLPKSVPPSERARRAKILSALSLARLTARHEETLALLRAKSQPLENVLLEKVLHGPGGGAPGEWLAGYTPNYLRVFLPKHHGLSRNQLIQVNVQSITINSASGDVAFVGQA